MYVQSTHLVPIRPCWLVFQIIKSTIIRQCGEEVCVYLNRFDQMVRAFYESDFFVRFKNWTGLNAGMENLILREEPTSIICLCRTFQISSVTPPPTPPTALENNARHKVHVALSRPGPNNNRSVDQPQSWSGLSQTVSCHPYALSHHRHRHNNMSQHFSHCAGVTRPTEELTVTGLQLFLDGD